MTLQLSALVHLLGERVPAGDTLLSLFEPEKQISKRQTPGRPGDFGRKCWLEEVEAGIVTGSRVREQLGQGVPLTCSSASPIISAASAQRPGWSRGIF